MQKISKKVLPNQFNCINLQQIYWQNNADYSLAWLNSGKIYKGQKSTRTVLSLISTQRFSRARQARVRDWRGRVPFFIIIKLKT